MKLTEEQLELGRDFIKNNDLKSLDNWLNKYAKDYDRAYVLSTFKKMFDYEQEEKALSLFNRAFTNYDPTKYRIKKYLIIIFCIIIFILLVNLIWQ